MMLSYRIQATEMPLTEDEILQDMPKYDICTVHYVGQLATLCSGLNFSHELLGLYTV